MSALQEAISRALEARKNVPAEAQEPTQEPDNDTGNETGTPVEAGADTGADQTITDPDAQALADVTKPASEEPVEADISDPEDTGLQSEDDDLGTDEPASDETGEDDEDGDEGNQEGDAQTNEPTEDQDDEPANEGESEDNTDPPADDEDDAEDDIEAEDDDKSDETFDEEGSLKTLDEVKEAAKGTEEVSSSASIIEEAKELSDRLGDLARELVEREGKTDASTESIRRMLRISLEAINDRADMLLGEHVDIIDGEDPHKRAIELALSSARFTVRQAREYANNVASHNASAAIQVLREQVAGLTGPIQNVIPGEGVLRILSVRGEIDLKAYSVANVVHTFATTINRWLSGNIRKYVLEAAEGKAQPFPKLSSAWFKENPVLADSMRAEGSAVVGNLLSPELPGDSVFAYVGEAETPIVSLITTHQSTRGLMEQLVSVDKIALERVLDQLQVYAATVALMSKTIDTLLDVITGFESWVQSTWDKDKDAVDALKLQQLLPALVTTPTDTFYFAYGQYVALTSVVTAAVGANSSEAAPT